MTTESNKFYTDLWLLLTNIK